MAASHQAHFSERGVACRTSKLSLAAADAASFVIVAFVDAQDVAAALALGAKRAVLPAIDIR